jgi:diphthamide biosynthesis methyltransferase
MLYLVGLGLADETDITVKGLEVVKRAERVYLEAYTSILLVEKEKLVRSISPTCLMEHIADQISDLVLGSFLWSPGHSCRP